MIRSRRTGLNYLGGHGGANRTKAILCAMATLGSSANPSSASASVGALLREWRSTRRLSQLDLALAAEVSARHISYVETGKAQPSREMVTRLADTLEMPLRERNALLVAAGYAAQYPQTALAAPELARIHRAIDFILAQQEPYPAFVIDRHWDILMANQAAQRVNRFLLGGRPSPHANMLRHVFDPGDLRAALVNWEEVAGDLIRHLHNEIAAAPADASARALLDEALAYPDVPQRWRTRELGAAPSPLLTTAFRRGEQELRFFSSITVFAAPRDITLDELRIECCFPMDDATAVFCRELKEKDTEISMTSS
jgi:transcriptional regulator with XRE-family HTH domain